jgi:hypothetical protein
MLAEHNGQILQSLCASTLHVPLDEFLLRIEVLTRANALHFVLTAVKHLLRRKTDASQSPRATHDALSALLRTLVTSLVNISIALSSFLSSMPA